MVSRRTIVKGRERTKLTEHSRKHGEKDQSQRRRQQVHTTHDGGVVEYGLEVNREIIFSHQNSSKKEEQIGCSRPDNTLLDHGKWQHGVVALVVFPDEEDDECDASADQKANDNRAVPWVQGATVLQSKQKHDSRGADEEEAWKIQRFEGCAEDLSRGQLVYRLGDVNEKQKNGQSTANWKVDVKACSKYQ